jgi:starch synthase
MKVLCISFWFYNHAIMLANSLSKRESVMLMLPRSISDEHRRDIAPNVKLYLFDQPKRLYHPFNLLTVQEIVKETYKFNPDVIHLQFNNFMSGFILSLLRGYPLVGTFHDVSTLHKDENFLIKLAFNYSRSRFDRIIVHSNKLKDAMTQQYSVPLEKVHSLPIGKGEVAFYEAHEKDDVKENDYLILYYGRICKYKGLDYLIKAEPFITKAFPHARIVIAGRGEDFKKYERLIVNKNSFIIYNRYIPYDMAAKLFQRCSVVVLPYIGASQIEVVPVAYRFKKPVVATSVCGISEIVDDGVTGFIVPRMDSKALAEAVIKLLRNDELRKQMGENGYNKLDMLMLPDNIADRTIKVYSEAVLSRSATN